MPDLTDPLSLAYLDYLTAERKPPNTIARKRAVLTSVGNAGTATREQVEAWWATRRDMSDATRANDLSCLRSFIRWCQIWEHRDDDPTLRLTAPSAPRGLPRPLSRHDLHRALDAFPDDLRRALALGAYAGLRVSEAAALMWVDVDTESRRIAVRRSKGGKSRLIAVSPVLIDHLLPEHGGNVVSGTDKVIPAAVLQRRGNRALRALGITSTWHSSRHRFGTMAYQATGDLLAVGQAMGHGSPVTTQIYAQASGDMAERIAAAVVR